MLSCFISNNFYRESYIEGIKGRKLTKEERDFYGLNKFLPNIVRIARKILDKKF